MAATKMAQKYHQALRELNQKKNEFSLLDQKFAEFVSGSNAQIKGLDAEVRRLADDQDDLTEILSREFQWHSLRVEECARAQKHAPTETPIDVLAFLSDARQFHQLRVAELGRLLRDYGISFGGD